MRTIRLIGLFVCLVAVIFLAVAALSTREATAQGGNLLQNPGFEAGFYTFVPDDYPWLALYASQREDCRLEDGTYMPCNTAQTPVNWIPWWISQTESDPPWKNRQPEYKPAIPPYLNRIHSGSAAAQYFTFHSTHTAGLLQVVTVPTNASVTFSIWGQAWSSASDATYSDYPTPVNMRIGIDPTGGSNPYNPAIVWSDYKQPYDAYVQFSVQAQAQGDKVTVFTISSPDEARKHNDIYWDDAELVASGGAPPPAPTAVGGSGSGGGSGDGGGTQISQSSPTATPNAEGIIYAEVLPGDSFWSIAARHGITLEEILEFNNRTETDFVIEGELLIVGYAEPEEEATPEGEVVTDTVAAATEEPTPTATPELPTATPEPAGGEVCLLAFVDEDQDGNHGPDEPMRSAVAFTVTNPDSEQVVLNYVTDGASEPYCVTLEAGNYRIVRSKMANEVLTTQGEQALSITDGAALDYDFGSYTNETAVAEASAADAANSAALAADASAAEDADEGGVASVLVIVAVVVAVVLFVGVLMMILSARRTTV